MSFGENFKRETELPKANEGEHIIRLVSTEEKFKEQWHWLQFNFEYLDKVKRVPNNFALFSPPAGATEGQIHAFNVRATKIMDCFGLKGDFSANNRLNWVNAVGKVEIKKNQAGMFNVSKFIKKEESGITEQAREQALF